MNRVKVSTFLVKSVNSSLDQIRSLPQYYKFLERSLLNVQN